MNITGTGSAPITPFDYSQVLAGQQFVPDLTGFSGGGSWDPAGIAGSDPTSEDSNPNPQGNWQSLIADIATLAAVSFVAFESGSPSVATPSAQASSGSNVGAVQHVGVAPQPINHFNGKIIALVLVGVGVLYVLVKSHK